MTAETNMMKQKEESKGESVAFYLKKYEKLKKKRTPWHDLWQFVGEYVHTKKVSFTQTSQPGSFLNKEVFDSTGPKSSKKMASSLIGLLWQNGGKSIQMEAPEELKNLTKEETDFYKFMTAKVAGAYDDPKAGFPLVLEEYMNDQTSFGTSGIFTEDGKKQGTLLSFKALGVDGWCFDEGSGGAIVKAYGEKKWTLEAAAEEYGLEMLSKKSQEAYAKNPDDEICILQIIEPRIELDPSKKGNQFMPFKSVHIEMEAKHKIKESGFEEAPAGIVRFSKRLNEVYGRSPAMDALPDILTINQVREDRLIANEKRLEPPLGMYSDGLLGSNQLDTSARGINIFNPQGKIAGKSDPIWPLYTVGDINAADEEIADLKQSITEHFMLDRLLDFNNQAQMTLGEAQMRQQIRGEGVVPVAMRQAYEGFIVWIERGVAIIYRKGEFGVAKGTPEERFLLEQKIEPKYIPDRIAKLILSGKEFYKIKFVTPAARLMQAEEAQGAMRTFEFVGQAAQLYPEARDLVNIDEAVKFISKSFGTPPGIIREGKELEDLRTAMAQKQQAIETIQAQQAQNQLQQQGADASKASAEAERTEQLGA